MAIYEVYKESCKAGTDGKIELRAEQKKAVHDARVAFAKPFSDKRPFHKFLWNAKMRFGKTLCAMQLAKEMGVKRTLIVTHRPVVNKSWAEDFDKVFEKNACYKYGTKFEADHFGNFDDLEKFASKDGNHYVFFASMQYLRRSELVNDGGDSDALKKKILQNNWDLVVVDEAHEGTLTFLGSRVVSMLSKPKTCVLHLSGTPFNLYEDFDTGEIFTWDYIAEQKSKREWSAKYPMLSNPYAELPTMKIFTYDLGKLVKGEGLLSKNAGFMFSEFFRTWTGNTKIDGAKMPEGAKGKFVHENSVKDFLDLMCKEDETSNYPFSRQEYQENFKHTLWVVPGVAAAKALETLLHGHEIFSGFDVINVAGNADDDELSDNALDKVLKKIGELPEQTNTITISCGRLTTGTTVRPWTAVFYMKGSENTNAATYMQTIFRVQTPYHTNDGRMKAEAYVFDFAPDRSLKMLAEAARFFAKTKGKGKLEKSSVANERELSSMRELLDFCPVISYEGGKMTALEDANTLFAKLSEAKIDRVVQRGFDDTALYNVEELLKKDPDSINRLLDILGKTVGTKATKVDLAAAGLKGSKKPKPGQEGPAETEEPSEADIEAKEAAKAARKERDNRIAILRGVSLRIPLLMFGAEVANEETDVTVDNFAGLVDDASWTEFMPRGFTKEDFKEIESCYDPVVFKESWQRYRHLAREADSMPIEERIKAITTIFGYFHNPDKETVLTPWRVVNMHMSDTIGGWCFYNDKFDGPNLGTRKNGELVETAKPRWVEQKGVTKALFGQADDNGDTSVRILEINSKTGLYPLYVTYSLYRSILPIWQKLYGEEGVLSLTDEQALWDKILQENIFVICNTPMAARITERTLRGFRKVKGMHIKDEKLVEQATTDQDALVKKLNSEKFWIGKGTGEMKFNAIVGNPPYQIAAEGDRGPDRPIYHQFVEIARLLSPNCLSMIMPSRWCVGGSWFEGFMLSMKTDRHISKLVEVARAKDCFPGTSISGGVCWFLRNSSYDGDCVVENLGLNRNVMSRKLDEFPSIIRQNSAVAIVRKIRKDKSLSESVSAISPFGLPTKIRGVDKENVRFNVRLYHSSGVGYIADREISKGRDLLSSYKVMVSQTSAEHACEPDSSGMFKILTSTTRILKPMEACTHSYVVLGPCKNKRSAENLLDYLKTKFVRFLMLQNLASIHISKSTFQFVPEQDFSKPWTDEELYKKYKLTKPEIDFIESMIKPME